MKENQILRTHSTIKCSSAHYTEYPISSKKLNARYFVFIRISICYVEKNLIIYGLAQFPPLIPPRKFHHIFHHYEHAYSLGLTYHHLVFKYELKFRSFPVSFQIFHANSISKHHFLELIKECSNYNPDVDKTFSEPGRNPDTEE